MTMWMHEFSVINTSQFNFPVDMLRYDSCYPGDQESASKMMLADGIYNKGRDKQELVIRLKHLDDRKDWYPTEGRWKSFGWNILHGEYRVFKV